MVDLLYCEILKLKRSKMFLISVLGAVAAPFMCFLGCIKYKFQYPDKTIMFSKMFSETNLYVLLLVGAILYGVITAYLFSREYAENTLKSILTIPISKVKFILGKYIMLFLWIIVLTIIEWLMACVFGFVAQLDGLNGKILIESLQQYLIGGSLIFLLMTPFVFITLWLRSLFPSIVLSAVITMANMALTNDVDFVSLYPWTAVYVIASGEVMPKYPIVYSYIAIFSVSVIGFMASLSYFKKMDVR